MSNKVFSSQYFPEEIQGFDVLPDAAHVDVKVVAVLFGKSVNSIWRDTKRGLIPAPVRFGGSTRWRVGDLRRALASTV